MHVVEEIKSSDSITTKYIQECKHGRLHTVRVERPEKRIICFSSQLGCGMGCKFCASSNMGFKYNLTAQQIVDQCMNVIEGLEYRPMLFSAMGMGEPTLNPHILDAFVELAPMGKVSMSSIGLVPARIVDLYRRLRILGVHLKLQLSVHAPDDELRRYLLDRRLPSLKDTLDTLGGLSTLIEYNYTLIEGINDSPEQAVALAKLLHTYNGQVKLNRFNPIKGLGWTGSTQDVVELFKAVLESNSVKAEVYATDGTDIGAACGQLGLVQETTL